MQVVRCQAFASACAFAQLGSLIAPRLAKYDGAGYNTVADPFFLHLPRHTPHRHSPHYHHTRHHDTHRVFAASYSPSCSSSLTRYHTRRVSSLSHLSCVLAILVVKSCSPSHSSCLLAFLSSRRVLAAGILIEIVLVASYCTTSRCLCLCELR